MNVKIQISNGQIPTLGTQASAGYDLHSACDSIVTAKKWALIPCGFTMEMPVDWEAQIRPRSGLALNHGITVLNSPATIDSDYRGEIKVILYNVSDVDFVIKRGMRIAQMVFAKLTQANLIPTISIEKNTERGDKGFGSTGH